MKGKGKGKETVAAMAVAGKVKEAEEKVEAWMVSVSDNSEESSEEDSLSCFNSMSDLFEDEDSLPDLQYLSDSNNETDASGDLKSETVDSEEEPIASLNSPTPSNDPDGCSEPFDDFDTLLEGYEFIPIDVEAYMSTYEASVLQRTPGVLPTDVDLYDSGASQHMSGFKHCFINFVEIDPKPIPAKEKRSITVERSIKFNFKEEIIVGQLLLEGENPNSKPTTSQPLLLPSRQPAVETVEETNTPEGPDHLGDAFENPEPDEGRGKHIQKESAYVKRLREGQGVVDARPSTALLLEGLQEGVEGIEAGGLAEDEGNVIDDWEMVAVVEEFAMAVAIEGAEG